ncbi:hypothetical protein BCR44DRAFT_1497110 [Catenaria anguillulae PL171]|uniref:G-protein coupled receptors family 3 profile domain-containing protein n=1 Tax=Catenaria anguillulae PL171 TaxID=765915 RepID=A0A1Y2HX05_9FUNG|nr:hypothetical protein BCR44DRAFT_1497110 [Catenaria anguillulae PL171]
MKNSDITDHTATAVQTIFRNKDSYIDLLALDVVWTGDYGEHLLPLDGDAGLASALTLHNPQNVAAGLVNGKLALNERKSNPAFYGLISQVKEPYEGLTCNVLEYLIAEQAGTLLEPNRTLSTFDQLSPIGQRAINVAKRWRRWQSLGYFPLGFAEQSSAREWARGNALFMRNWPFATAVTRNAQVTWPWRLTKLPGGAATLGGWLWGASKYTRQPEASRRVLELFAGAGWQKAKALSEGMPPTIPALYNDSEVCAAIPMCSVVSQLKVARRPSGAAGVHYAAVSKIIATYWFDILRGFGGTVESLLDRMNREIAALLAIDVLGEPTNIATTSPAVAAFNSIASIEILLLTAALACFIAWRKTPIVDTIGLGFLVPVTVGVVMVLVLVYLTAGTPSSATCVGQYWVQGFGFAMTVGACGIHLFRLWALSSNPFVTRRQTAPRQVLVLLAPACTMTLAILIAFSATNWIGAYETTLPKSRYIGIHHTGPGQAEAKLLTLSLANAAFLALVLVPFIELDLVDQPTGFVLRSLVLTAAVGVFLGAYMAPRVWLAYRYWRDPAAAASRNIVMATGTMTTTPTGGATNTSPMMDPVKMLQASHMKRFDFGCQGVLTMRFARRSWTMYLTPWKLAQTYLLPRERVLVVQPFGSTAHARCIPLAVISRIDMNTADKINGNEFNVILASGGWIQFMAADAVEAAKWVGEFKLAVG